jgi:hypothetical protein
LALSDPHLATRWHEVAANIHASGRQIVIAVTGGGSGAISTLLQTPGASRTILEAIVPYSHAALTDWIGAKPEQACSAATARAMAMAAFMRARELSPEVDPTLLLGVGVTASLATDRVKRGERRLHLASQSALRTEVHSISLNDDVAERASDEAASTTAILRLIARSCGDWAAELESKTSDHWKTGGQDAAPEVADLLLGRRTAVVMPFESDPIESDAVAASVLFPGSFNPPHAGHLSMARIAETKLSAPVKWELSITNVDKPPLDFISIYERLEALRKDDSVRQIALTRAPTFREKSELFPGATFVVGADTLIRIADAKYYGGDPAKRDAAIAEIASRGCRFLTFGRIVNGEFKVLSELTLPPSLAAICDEVPAAEFRADVSSTERRNGSDNS